MSVSGTLSIIVAAIAVILGFLILRDINDDGNASGGGVGSDDTTAETTIPGGADVTTTAPSAATTAPATLKPYTVLVANAASVQGAAASMTTALQGKGVLTIPGTNSTATGAQATTTIYYTAGYELEAAELATIMGVTAPPQPMPDPPPVADLSTANVLVQLGTDKANQPLPAGTTGAATTDTATTPTT